MACWYRKLFNFQPWLYNANNVFVEPKNVMRSIYLSRSLLEASLFGKPRDEYEMNTDKVYGVIDILCKEGRLKEAIHFLFSTDWRQISYECDIYSRLLQGCIDKKSSQEAMRIHLYMIKHGFIPGLFLGNRLVNVYIKCGLLEYARQVFDKMSIRDVVSWTTMLAGYAKMGFIDNARQIFDEMPDRNVVSWNAMIAGYAQQGCGEEALQLFCKMQKAGVKYKSVTFVAILSASAGLEGLQLGKQIHAFILKVGFESNVFVGSSLLDMYAKCRCMDDAHQVFDKMPERNIVSWNVMVDGHGKYGTISEARYLFDNMAERSVASWTAMISGYAQRGDAEEALKLFCQMQQSCSQPDQFTYACVLSICASLSVFGYGDATDEMQVMR